MKVRLVPNRRFWTWALFFYMIVVAVLSLKPGSTTPGTPLQETVHNLCHVPAYAVMTLVVVGFLVVSEMSAVFLKAFCFSMLYGLLMEFLQSFVPGRTSSLSDEMLNGLGTLTMIFLIRQGIMRKIIDMKNQ